MSGAWASSCRLPLPLGAVGEQHLACPEAGHGLVAHPFLQRRLDVVDDGGVWHVDGGLRLLDRHTRLEPGEQIRPVVPPQLEGIRVALQQPTQRDRHVDVRRDAHRRAVERRRRHADNRQRLAVDDERLVDDIRVPVETRPPIVVAQHDDRRLAGGPVVGRANQPAKSGLHAEHPEVASRDERPFPAHRLAAVGEVGAEPDVRGQTGKRRLLPFEVAEHRVAEDLVAPAGLAARLRPRLRAGRRQVDQPRRFLDRQRPQEELLEEREDRGIGPDAQGEGGNGDGGDERCAEERAHRAPQRDCVHGKRSYLGL